MIVAQSAESHDIKQKFYKHRWCSYLQSSCKCVPTLGKENGIHWSLCIIQSNLFTYLQFHIQHSKKY